MARASVLVCAVAFLVVAVAITATHATPVYPCGGWKLYKQCGESWSGSKLGTGSLTICQAGCAMSCVAMSLDTMGERVSGQVTTPGTLNSWLIGHGGYVDGNLIVWNSIASLGHMHMTDFTPNLSPSQIQAQVRQCNPVIANVRDKTHWVLITGYDDKDDQTFYVNDPGFWDTSYDYSGMSDFVVYSNHSSTPVVRGTGPHQHMPALLKGH